MIYPFSVLQMESEGHTFWVARSTYLKGCIGQGDTQDEAIQELKDNELAWIETAKETGIPIPEVPVAHINDYSGKLTLRIAPYVHQSAVLYAKQEGISLNQYINDAVVTQNAIMAGRGIISG